MTQTTHGGPARGALKLDVAVPSTDPLDIEMGVDPLVYGLLIEAKAFKEDSQRPGIFVANHHSDVANIALRVEVRANGVGGFDLPDMGSEIVVVENDLTAD